MSRKQFSRGPYRLTEVKGYKKYFRFTTAEYNLRWVPKDNQRWAIDTDLHRIYQHEKRYQAYQEDLLSLFSYDDEYDSLTPLDFLAKARTFKQHYFPEWWEEQIKVSYNTRVVSEKPYSRNWPDLVRQNALCPEETGKTTLHELELWRGLLQQSQRIVFLPDDRRCFPNDLITWILPCYEHHQIFLYVKEQESPFSVSEAFAKNCLEQLNIPISSVNVVTDADSSPGIRYEDIIEDFYTQETCIVAKGIWNYFSLFRSDFPFIFSLNSKEDLARGLLQTAYSPEQPDSLKAIVGYQVRPFPQQVSLTGQDFCALSLEEFLNGQNPIPLSAFFDKKHQKEQAQNILRENVWHYAGFFTIDQENKSVNRVEQPGENTAYLQGIRFSPKDFTLIPQHFDHLFTIDTLPEREEGFLANFSYFFTGNLQQEYNRRVPTAEAIPMVNFLFDYRLEQCDGEKIETVPLYRKGFFGARKDGTLFIGYLSIKEITFKFQGERFTVPHHAINPALRDDCTLNRHIRISQDEPVYLFTPAYSQERIGQGRFNVVIINDTILHTSFQKAVTIPPVGVVLSFSPLFYEQHFQQTVPYKKIAWQVEFQEENVLQKSRLCWLYGGYNLLMLKGKNLVETPEQCEKTLRQEGWFLPQSMRTQETQLQNSGRQPRIVLGTTSQGQIFLLTLSGRTQISCGASYQELVLYCQYLLEQAGDRLVDLINLDGGASVFLAAIEAGQQHVLNFPAPFDLSPAGVIRPNSAVLKIIQNTNQ
jgi:hypothetical protein